MHRSINTPGGTLTEVQRLRMERGLTVAQLANLAKISLQTIYRMEQDPSDRDWKISISAADAVAEVFDVKPGSLFRATELSDGSNGGRPIRTGGERNHTGPIRIIALCPDCNQQVSAREKNDGESECCSAKLAA